MDEVIGITYFKFISGHNLPDSKITMAQPIRVLVLIPHLGGGGAEKVIALLARGLSHSRYEIHLALVTQADVESAAIPPGVTVHALGAPRVRAGAWKIFRLIWQLQPDVLLSGMAHLNFLVLLLRPFLPHETRILIRQNGTASAALAFGGLPGYTRLLYRWLYPRADRVICQTTAMAEDLRGVLHRNDDAIAVLPNPVDREEIHAAMRQPGLWSGTGPHLLAVGRLAREKGFDLLLDAMPAVRRRFPNADLVLAGAGPEEAALKTQCHSLGLDNAVCFAGSVNPPYALFPGATLFVLPSRHEGMPNALLEAACAGLPLVALPASGGVVDLLRHRADAWLASEISATALAGTLLKALETLHQQLPGRWAFTNTVPRTMPVSAVARQPSA